MNELVAKFESAGAVTSNAKIKRTPKNNDRTKRKSDGKASDFSSACFKRVALFLTKSRFGGIPFTILYGLVLFYYVTIILTDDVPLAEPVGADSTNVSSSINLTLIDVECGTSRPSHSTMNMSEARELKQGISQRTLIIGSSIGGATAVVLSVQSVFSVHTRCSLALVLPGIFAGRGRALILTFAMGMLLDGPIANINANLEQIMASLTCMYEQMQEMACRYQVQFRSLFGQFAQVLRRAQQILIEQQRQLAKQAEMLTKDLREEAEAAREDLERQIKDLQRQLDGISDVIDAPGNILNGACQGINSAISAAGTFFEDTGKDIKDAFEDVGKSIADFFGRKRRRKRSDGCGIPPVLPDVDIDVKGIDLDGLKEWVSRLAPDLDLASFNLDGFRDMLQSQSIGDIRYNLVKLLEGAFRLIQVISSHLKKVFYLASLILIAVDAFSYLRSYTSDGQFDNQYVDDNLRKLWKDGNKEKLTPIRRWELNEKYQVSQSFRLSKAEAKKILIQSIPTLVFTAAAAVTFVADFALVSFLEAILKHGQFGIKFRGMEQGIELGQLFGLVESGEVDLVSLKLEAFDLSTDPCLPRASRINLKDTALLWALVLVTGLSCVFDAYACRWRAQICNAFHPTRASQRAEQLHARIRAGRGSRRFHIKGVILRELERRRNLEDFSWWSRLLARIKTKIKGSQSKLNCPACQWRVKKEECTKVNINDGGKRVEAEICNDCHKDF